MIFYNGRVFDGKQMTCFTALEVKNGKIVELSNAKSGDVDLGGRLITPGLIDSHTHGYGGFDVMDGADAITSLAKIYSASGTTAFYPTSVSAGVADVSGFLEAVEKAKGAPGAKILGAHLEGPFLTTEKRGAHGEEFLLTPTIENYEKLTAGCGLVSRITLATELDEDLRLTKELTSRGIHVSAGHTTANGEDTLKALDAGVRTCVHFFNAMPSLHHRNRNITSVSLVDPRMKIEFIPDLLHVSADAVQIIMACKGDEGCFICTDSLPCAGLPNGDYEVGPIEVTIRFGEIYVRSSNCKTLAGSSITMLEGVRRLVSVGVPLETALRLGSANVAETFGLDLGRLLPGYPADMIVLDDQLSLCGVYIDGVHIKTQ